MAITTTGPRSRTGSRFRKTLLAPFSACLRPQSPEERDPTPIWQVQPHEDAASYWAKKLQAGTYVSDGRAEGFTDKIRCAQDSHPVSHPPASHLQPLRGLAGQGAESLKKPRRLVTEGLEGPYIVAHAHRPSLAHDSVCSLDSDALASLSEAVVPPVAADTHCTTVAQQPRESADASSCPATCSSSISGLSGPIALHGSKMQGAVGGRAGPASCDEPSTQGCYIDQGCTEDVQPLAKSISLGLTSLRKALKPIKVKPPPEKRFGMRHGPGVRDFHTTSAARVEQALIRLNAVLARGGRLPVAASP